MTSRQSKALLEKHIKDNMQDVSKKDCKKYFFSFKFLVYKSRLQKNCHKTDPDYISLLKIF